MLLHFGQRTVNAPDGALSSFLDDLAPKHPEYARLKKALARYRTIEATGGWSTLPAETVPDGDNTDLLRARLAVEDETATQGDLTEALQRYQSRNGLNPDGVLGHRTLPFEIDIGSTLYACGGCQGVGSLGADSTGGEEESEENKGFRSIDGRHA